MCGLDRVCIRGVCLERPDALAPAMADVGPPLDAPGVDAAGVDAAGVPCESNDEVSGLLGSYAWSDGNGGSIVGIRVDRALDFDGDNDLAFEWPALGGVSMQWTAEFTLARAESLTFEAVTEVVSSIELDDARYLLMAGPASSLTLELQAGIHQLLFRIDQVSRPFRVRLAYRLGDAGLFQPVSGPLFRAGSACDDGVGDCTDPEDALAFRTATNPFHCGACLHDCGSGRCDNGACVVRCAADRVDLDDDPENGCEVALISGLQCGRVDVEGPAIVRDVEVCAYTGAESTGTFELHATQITIEGSVNAAGRGFGGGGGGGGGTGSELCGELVCPAQSLPFRGGRAGGHASGGESGGVGQEGLRTSCVDDLPSPGANGGPGGRGGSDVSGGRGGRAGVGRTGGRGGASAAEGEAGGYDSPGTNTDMGTDATVRMGGGGGGGGGAGGTVNQICCGALGGGGGGAGSPGGGRVLLFADQSIVITESGSIMTFGLDAVGASGLDGVEVGGDGGDATNLNGSSLGGRTAVPDLMCTDDVALATVTNGGRGGRGGGGGILLWAPNIMHDGVLDARGGTGSLVNAGLVKVFQASGETLAGAGTVEAHRVSVIHPAEL